MAGQRMMMAKELSHLKRESPISNWVPCALRIGKRSIYFPRLPDPTDHCTASNHHPPVQCTHNHFRPALWSLHLRPGEPFFNSPAPFLLSGSLPALTVVVALLFFLLASCDRRRCCPKTVLQDARLV